MNSYLNPTI